MIELSAREAVRLLVAREITPDELIDAALARMDAVDPAVNAVPTRCEERARAAAKRLPTRPPGDGRGWLAGLPVLIKDLVEVAGVRTTYGSLAFRDHVPAESALPVQAIEARGGIVLGKTNTPELGAGANTFNEVFGITRNPWDTRLTCGGSSGGSAVALATGMAWLADGSDLGGSLRTPASFCSVVGLRPSPGRVPQGPEALPFQTLAVEGPMARDVRDCALFLDVLAGHDPRDPRSFADAPEPFAAAAERPVLPRSVAFSPDLGGLVPVDARVDAACRAAADALAAAACEVVEASPDLQRASDAFMPLRAALFSGASEELLAEHRDELKPEVVWNIEAGLELSARELAAADRTRGVLAAAAVAFMGDHDLLLCPAAIVPPFPVEQRWLEGVGEHRFETYVDWLAITYALTVTGLPVLALPCGFTPEGLPVGLQLVGKPRGEAALLSHAAAVEDLLGVAARVPRDPVVTHAPPADT